jgi:hypothetical protein
MTLRGCVGGIHFVSFYYFYIGLWNCSDSVTFNFVLLLNVRASGEKRCNCLCFEIDQEMDAILLIIGIVYGVCRIVIKSVQQCTYFYLFSPDARTFHNIYKLQKHVLLRHQSYLIVFMGNKKLRFWQIMPL